MTPNISYYQWFASHSGQLPLDLDHEVQQAETFLDGKWIGVELRSVKTIISRFESINDEKESFKNYRNNYNLLFPEEVLRQRIRRGHWTPKTVRYKTDNGTHRELKLDEYVTEYMVGQEA